MDVKRCHKLLHQLKRLNKPTFVVTKEAAQRFPVFWKDNGEHSKLFYQFDRILCDVPCSGDGTSRKNFDVWSKWLPSSAFGVHFLQFSIAKRGVHLLKPGGRLVYSTCSLNPIENEAVVVSLLKAYPNELELVDSASELPGFKFSPALTTWRVYDMNHKWYERHADLPPNRQSKIPESCFPPTSEEAEFLHLVRCMRVYHHLQDTGGFFLAVLKKKSHQSDSLNIEGPDVVDFSPPPKKTKTSIEQTSCFGHKNCDSSSLSSSISSVSDATSASSFTSTCSCVSSSAPTSSLSSSPFSLSAKSFFVPSRYEAPFILFNMKMKAYDEISDYFGVDMNALRGNLIVRDNESAKSIYFINDGVFDFLRTDPRHRSIVVNMGLKVFTRHRSRDIVPCSFRLVNEGLPSIFSFLTKQIVRIPDCDLFTLLTVSNPLFHQFTLPTQEVLNGCASGSLVFISQLECCSSLGVQYFAGWKGKVSCHLLVGKIERKSLMLILEDIGISLCKKENKILTEEEKNLEETSRFDVD